MAETIPEAASTAIEAFIDLDKLGLKPPDIAVNLAAYIFRLADLAKESGDKDCQEILKMTCDKSADVLDRLDAAHALTEAELAARAKAASKLWDSLSVLLSSALKNLVLKGTL